MTGRLPARHRFPGGYTVDIRLSPRGSGVLDADDMGAYETVEADRGVIHLWEGLTPRQRWHTLLHELLHALVDAQSYVEGTK